MISTEVIETLNEQIMRQVQINEQQMVINHSLMEVNKSIEILIEQLTKRISKLEPQIPESIQRG